LRGLAALLVTLSHLTASYVKLFPDQPASSILLHADGFAVILFFMISGFVILMTLEKCQAPLDFVVSRFSRLYPAYWASVLLTFAVVSSLGLPGHERNFGQMLINLTMIQDMFRTPHVDWSYWTLQIELFFYAGMFLIYCVGGLSRVEWFLFGWLLLRLFYLLAPHFNLEPSFTLGKILILDLIPYFGLGMCFYKIYAHYESQQRKLNIGILVSCAALALLNITLSGEGLFSAICGILIFALFVMGYLRWLVVWPMVWLGAISYPLYLLHQYIGFALIRRMEASGFSPNISTLCAIFTALFLAAVVTYSVERPAMRWIRACYRSIKDVRTNMQSL